MIRTPLEVSLENGRKIVDFRCGGSFGVILDGKPFTILSQCEKESGFGKHEQEERERCVFLIKDVKSCRGHRIRFIYCLCMELEKLDKPESRLFKRKERGTRSLSTDNQRTSLSISLAQTPHASHTQSNLLTLLFLFTH